MKNIEKVKKIGILKKIFIKLCRKLGYEIIDQNNFKIPTLDKDIDDELSKLGKYSINLPLGIIKTSRKVKSMDIIIRTCTSVNMLTQNKKRLFEKEKIEYTLRTIKSLLNSVIYSTQLEDLEIKFTVIDHDSSEQSLEKIKKIFENYDTKFKLINLDLTKFENKIKKVNEKGENVSLNQLSNMANINQSLLEARNAKDLIYFVEDDYLHTKNSLSEMILTYERISSQLNREIIICPSDYPYLYTKAEYTQNFLGEKNHWRKISESLCTFLTSRKMVEKYWDKFVSMCEKEHYPFEKPLHDIYEKELCISPIPSLALHFTNINSIFGLSPNTDWKKIWEENEN